MPQFRYSPLILLFGLISLNAQTKWTVDKAHSDVQFSVTHLIISEVSGKFKSFDANIEVSSDDFTDAKIEFSSDVQSISTDNEGRDKHLKSDDFFNAEKYPKITFKGKSFTKVGQKNYKLVGDFTIRDVTKEIALDVTYNGLVKDPWGNIKAGFKIQGEINRFDYNLKWNTLMEAGGAVVGKNVNIIVNLELQKSK